MAKKTSAAAVSPSRLIAAVQDFLQLESASGILLVAAAAIAMVMMNSPLAAYYIDFVKTPVAIRIGEFEIFKPMLLWINDGLMAVFFFLVGLELKREFIEGHLSRRDQAILPAIGALGGMVVPAGIYAYLNWHDPVTLHGWAIPSATDIAFALGVLMLFGKQVPTALKIFLLTLAILDDLGAIVIIAIFYTSNLSVGSLVTALAALATLIVFNRRGVVSVAAYMLVGIVMWASVLKSGVHATLAGVALAMTIPLRDPKDSNHSPLRELEHDLHPAVAYVILPLFAFANAGVPLKGITLETLFAPVPLGIAAGLFVGKQIGVFGAVWATIKLKMAALPAGVNWRQIYGVSVLCGIGFTMSLFIGTLAFENAGPGHAAEVRLGILLGSLLSAVVGYAILRLDLPRR